MKDPPIFVMAYHDLGPVHPPQRVPTTRALLLLPEDIVQPKKRACQQVLVVLQQTPSAPPKTRLLTVRQPTQLQLTCDTR